MKIIAFRTPKPKRFEYKPLFYSEEKEKLQKRQELVKGLSDKENPSVDKDFLREEMRYRWQASRRRRQGTIFGVGGPLLIAAAIALVVLLLYLVYSSGIF